MIFDLKCSASAHKRLRPDIDIVALWHPDLFQPIVKAWEARNKMSVLLFGPYLRNRQKFHVYHSAQINTATCHYSILKYLKDELKISDRT